jgi:hypothetical protein
MMTPKKNQKKGWVNEDPKLFNEIPLVRGQQNGPRVARGGISRIPGGPPPGPPLILIHTGTRHTLRPGLTIAKSVFEKGTRE